MHTLKNDHVSLTFSDEGRLVALADASGAVQAPIDAEHQTAAVEIELADAQGEVMHVFPQAKPLVETSQEADAQVLTATWELQGDWGALSVRGRVELGADTPLSAWTVSVDNRTDCAVWQVAWPRVSGLTEFADAQGPAWLATPVGIGEKTPRPVWFVNHHESVISNWSREQYGCFDVEGGPADLAYSYPGMWTMQVLAYGHPLTGGIYFAAHDGRALYKRFGMYADGNTGEHAALVLKQYPEDRTARGADFHSLYPAMVGVYHGDWWGACALYRAWALEQMWCEKGPTKDRADIPQRSKDLDLWYWNWQFSTRGRADEVVPIIKAIKERFECNVAFHWYGFAGGGLTGGRTPEVFPHDPDIRRWLRQGVKDLHLAGVQCIPYINPRLCRDDILAFEAIDGERWICRDEHGKSADPWGPHRHTMCPTAQPHQELMRRITNEMIDEIGMDGAYLDQISSCYSVPCFVEGHDHPPGGHDHWVRGYRDYLEKVQQDIKSRSPDHIITSESVIECYLDLLDLDLAREISSLTGHVGSPASIPIPMFHSVYHDYHMSYGTVSTFRPRTHRDEVIPEGFRLREALCLVGGGQLMISGLFAGDEVDDQFAEPLAYMEELTRAHAAGRRFFNLGEWKPPLPVACETVSVTHHSAHAPKEDIPAVLSGCFALDGEACAVLVNHTDRQQEARVTVDPAACGTGEGPFELRAVYPQDKVLASGRTGTGPLEQPVMLAPASAQVWRLGPVQ